MIYKICVLLLLCSWLIITITFGGLCETEEVNGKKQCKSPTGNNCASHSKNGDFKCVMDAINEVCSAIGLYFG